MATGPVKGFAVTLTIGIVASMFSALLVTRNCFNWAIDSGVVRSLSMSSLIKHTGFDFLKAAPTLGRHFGHHHSRFGNRLYIPRRKELRGGF